MAYLSQAQARLLDGLRQNLAAVEANQQDAQDAKDDLDEIAQEQKEQKAKLEQEKSKRSALLGSLSKKLSAQRSEAGKLERDQQRLSSLVDNLTKLIKQEEIAAAKARAEAEARAKAKAEALAKARAERERERLAKASVPGKPSASFKVTDPIDDVEPPATKQASAEKAAEPEVSLLATTPDGTFKNLKGQMHSPVNGKVAARFGARHGGDGPAWKGVFIKAPEGTEVRAVAPGRVVTSDWIRGLGNIVVINHGNDYMSVYAYNQTLYKRPGDIVKAGDVIASVGNTGGNEESGLYFELRHLGAAFDPASWVKF
jgi:septal ring factor EnvC (AmiA/AmiB activator)